MYSIDFPDFLSGGRVKLLEGNKATLSNTHLLLLSWKNSLFGDPYFGCNLKRYIYEQNNIILQDIIIDDIFMSLQQFIPQVLVKRDDIKIMFKGNEVFASINCINKLDNESNLYEINLTSDE